MFKSQTQRFSFYKNGESGRGVASVKTRYYLSTSKESPTGGSWSYTAPSWEKEKFLWIRDEVTYTDGDVVYTEPYCDSSWEAVREIDEQILSWCMDNDKTYINGAKIYTGTITADKLKVNELSSLSANLGTVTAGSLTSNTVINVTTDLTVGNKIYLGASNTEEKGIIFGDDQMKLTIGTNQINFDAYNDRKFILTSLSADNSAYSNIDLEPYDIELTSSNITLMTTGGDMILSNQVNDVDFFGDVVIFAGRMWNSGEVPANGYLSGSAKQLWFSIPVGPTMVGITKANCTSLKMNLRTVNGTFVGEGYQEGGHEYVGESNYTITTEVNLKTNTIIVGMRQTVSYNATDQSPISVSILDSTFEFE